MSKDILTTLIYFGRNCVLVEILHLLCIVYTDTLQGQIYLLHNETDF